MRAIKCDYCTRLDDHYYTLYSYRTKSGSYGLTNAEAKSDDYTTVTKNDLCSGCWDEYFGGYKSYDNLVRAKLDNFRHREKRKEEIT